MVAGNHQGIVAVVKSFKFNILEELIIAANNVDNPIILVLDEIKDPHNLGGDN